MKAILVIDEMPKTCGDCPIRFSGEPNEWCWYLKHGLDDIKSKPTWCPLRPLPNFKAVDLNDTRDVMMFCHGWNTCLEEIEDD